MFGDQAWKIDLDRRALSDFRVDLHMASALLDEAIDLAEAQSRALADRLGCEERLEGLVERRGGHSDAGIGNANGNILPRQNLGMVCRVDLIDVHVGGFDREL